MRTDNHRWLWAVTKQGRGHFAALLLMQGLRGVSGVVYALLLRGIVDAATARELAAFRQNVLLIVLLVLVQLALRSGILYVTELCRAETENSAKERLLGQLLRKDYAAVSAVHSGEWMNRLTNDTLVLANAWAEILPGLSGMAVKLISALVVLTAMEPRFAATLMLLGLVLIGLSAVMRRRLKALHRTVQERDGRLRIFLQERLSALLILRSFAAEEQTRAEGAAQMDVHRKARMDKIGFSSICNFGYGLAISGMYVMAVIWCGLGILKGVTSFGTLTAVLQLVSQIQAPITNISSYLPKYYSMLASVERLREAEALAEDGEAALPVDEVRQCWQEELDGIELRDVSYTYYPAADAPDALDRSGQPQVIRGFSLSLEKGETLALTGRSGCGKSTVLKLLMGLYRPDAGETVLRERGGGTRALDSRWRRLFAYVPQGNRLMNGTIREVVSFASPADAGDEERLRHALAVACADFVFELEQGTDTMLGERGAGLSEGQMQRLAIARAVFAGSPVLILDEATSALDEKTERQLLENLRQMTDRTVVIVTHRPAALSICDQVIAFAEEES